MKRSKYLFFFLPVFATIFLNFNSASFHNSCDSSNNCPHITIENKMPQMEMPHVVHMLDPDISNAIKISVKQNDKNCSDSYCWICSNNFPFKKEEIVNNFRITYKSVDYFLLSTDINLLVINNNFRSRDTISTIFYNNINVIKTTRLNC